MSHLKISLFGAPLIEVDHTPIEFGRRKAIALLAYLAVTDQPHTRDTLATLLWPDYGDVDARAYLRGALHSIRAALGENWLQSDREMIALQQNEDTWIDVREFRSLIAECQTHPHLDELACSPCSDRLRQAAELYRADFMVGFNLPDSIGFNEWQSFQTEALRRELGAALERLVKNLSAQWNFPEAIAVATRWLAMELSHEAVHRHLMSLYTWNGQREAALSQFDMCQTTFKALGILPDAATVALYTAIKDDQLPPPETRPTKTAQLLRGIKHPLATPKHNLPVKRTPFLARESELTQIELLLAEPTCRLLTLIGLGGIGKTRLALEAAEDQVNCFAQGVVYVALVDLNSLELLIQEMANALQFRLQGSEAPQVQLFQFLREKELLLVLDNFDHLLHETEFIGALLAAAPHLKILTTSREPLALEQERLFRVEGMPYPDSG